MAGFGIWIRVLGICACLWFVGADPSDKKIIVKKVNGQMLCTQGWECEKWSRHCCNKTISDFFKTDQFENLFPKRNLPLAHAVGFWDYISFITAAAIFEPEGFGTTGGEDMQKMEVAAFLGHVGAITSCYNGVADGEPLVWGLCYNKELSPSHNYCNNEYRYVYPCAPEAQYFSRGAIPITWNFNYGEAGIALNVDLLNHPEYIEQNATLAFLAAIRSWMVSKIKNQPSAHDAFVGSWIPTKIDKRANRVPGFGTTMNVMYGDRFCGQGDIEGMNKLISHYLHYLDLMGVDRELGGSNEVLSCADQVPFTKSSSTKSPSSSS